MPSLLSQLAVVDALLNNKEAAISEAKRAVEMLPISKDAVDAPGLSINLAVVYAWANDLGFSFRNAGAFGENARRYLLWPAETRSLLGSASERSAL